MKTLKRLARRGVFTAVLVACSAASLPAQTSFSQYQAGQAQHSQSSNWQPNRLPTTSSTQSVSRTAGSQTATQGAADASGVVLRWRESTRLSARAQTSSSHLNKAAAALEEPAAAVRSRAQVALSASPSETSSHQSNPAWVANPLRDSGAAQPATRQTHYTQTAEGTRGSSRAERSAVRAAAYQAPAGALDAFGDGSNAQQPPSLPPTQLQPMPSDPLSRPELAPPPPSSLPQAPVEQPQLSLPQRGAPQLGMPEPSPMPELDDLMPAAPGQAPARGAQQPQPESPSPFDRAPAQRDSGSPSDIQERSENMLEQLERRSGADASANCEAFRDRLRSSTLDKIDLKSGPRFGQGLGGDPRQTEKMRLNFAAEAEEREWCDREGRTLVQGRMVDLYNELVVLDVGGVRREIPLRDLCDVDLAYIGKAWNLPTSCGSGHDVYAARGFVPSAIQWKASGLCHKPLYFEEVQLERYGHELGPVLQPLVSTAHFFGNIAVLPYKMGIHPPHECQYALGYYRPGDCAPYMVPPIPFSLRGAAAQAGVVVGAAGLIP